MKEFEPMYNEENVSTNAHKAQKMDFVSLYTKLYNENFEELEKLRIKDRNVTIAIFIVIFACIFCCIVCPLLMPLVIIGVIVFVVVLVVKTFNQNKQYLNEIKNEQSIKAVKDGQDVWITKDSRSVKIVKKDSYKAVFKEKIITPIIQNEFPGSEYVWYRGLDRSEYRRGEWESYDLYDSEDQIISSINIPDFEDFKSELVMSEVHTQNESTDSEGRTTRTTVFHGLVGHVNLPKDIGCYIRVTRNKFKLFGGSKHKLDMDMSEFEKVFDVETDDKIKAMQILTADVMTDLIKMLEVSKVKFEFYINHDKMYIRFHTGELFEPSTFGKSMQFDMLKKYCDITNGTIKAVEDICNKVMSVEL